MILVGNKSDLGECINEREIGEWAKDNGVMYIKTSVKNDVNVNECYKRLS